MSEASRTPGQAAEEYAKRGWRPLLLHGIREDRATCTCARGADCKTPGKHPVDREWQNTPAAENPSAPWAGWRAGHNIGIATGDASGFWVLDIDPDKGGSESAARLAREHPEMFDPTIVVITGGNGWHYWFTMPDFPVSNSAGGLKGYPGIDVRGTGGQVVAPPSRTDKGPYRLSSSSAETIGAAPEWLLEMIRPKARSERAVEVPAVEAKVTDPRLQRYFERARQAEISRLVTMSEAAVPDGHGYRGEPWDQTTYAVACNLLELAHSPWNGYSVEQAYSDVLRYAPTDDGFTSEQVNVKWESAVKRVDGQGRPVPENPVESMISDLPDMKTPPTAAEGVGPDVQRPAGFSQPTRDFGFGGSVAAPAPAREYPRRTWDDIGNGRRLVDHYGHQLRHVAEAEGWALYTDGRWSHVKPNIVVGLCQELIAEQLATTEAMTYSDIPEAAEDGKEEKPSDRDGFLSFVAKQRMAARVGAAIAMASGRSEIFASTNDFDAHHHLLNAGNGVIDLRDGSLSAHDPALLMMKRTDVPYSPMAACPRWQAFLDRVVPDLEQQQYLQRIVGYSLTGETISQAFFIHYGAGANGKSVFLQVMRAVVGDYGQTIPRETLLAKKDSEHPTSIARMIGMRFLEVSETAPGRRLDEEAVKNLTGGEKTTARFMGKDFFDFTPTGKIHYVTNHLPLLSDAMSIWRRLHLMKWDVRIPDQEQDPRLAEKLIAQEAAGVLAWAVRGAMAWHEQGLNMPESMVAELDTYRRDSDTFGEFLTEKVVQGPSSVALLKDVFASYEAWCFQSQIKRPMTRQSFSATLKERGFEPVRVQGRPGFKGLSIQPVVVDTSWADL